MSRIISLHQKRKNNAVPLRRWESHILTIYRQGECRRRPQWWEGSAGTSSSGGESLSPWSRKSVPALLMLEQAQWECALSHHCHTLHPHWSWVTVSNMGYIKGMHERTHLWQVDSTWQHVCEGGRWQRRSRGSEAGCSHCSPTPGPATCEDERKNQARLDQFDMSNFGFCLISVSPLSGTVQIWNPAGGYLCAGRYMTPATANIKIEQTDYIDSLTTHIDLYYNGQQGKGWRQDVFEEYLKDKPWSRVPASVVVPPPELGNVI